MAIPPAEITPALPVVAARLLSRTRDGDGRELGVFDDDTNPTAEQATEVVAECARFIALRLGRPGTSWDGDLKAAAKDAVAARAALRIETDYYSDGSSQNAALIIELGKIAREQLDALLEIARDNQVGGQQIHSIRIVSANRRTRP